MTSTNPFRVPDGLEIVVVVKLADPEISVEVTYPVEEGTNTATKPEAVPEGLCTVLVEL